MFGLASRSKGKIEQDSSSDGSDEDTSDKMTDEEAIQKFTRMIDGLSEKDKKNKFVQQMLDDFKQRKTQHLEKKKKGERKQKQAQTKEFRKLLREKNSMNDIKYFKNSMSKSQQRVVIDQIKAIKSHCQIDKPYRLALLDSDIPIPYKACAYRKINTLKYMEPGGGEYYKIKNWVDTFMQIPFGKHKKLPSTIDDGVDKCHEFMENAKKILDGAAYGLNDAKEQIMQMVGTWIANPNAIGTAIAIKGPMGTGKTTLVKDGISKILGRDFAFIALGGATDSSFLEGHSYTYEGSTWGKIVDILIKCKSMNPVFYFDELDKVIPVVQPNVVCHHSKQAVLQLFGLVGLYQEVCAFGGAKGATNGDVMDHERPARREVALHAAAEQHRRGAAGLAEDDGVHRDWAALDHVH